MAGRSEGSVYDRLLEVQADLSRGEDGTGKPMTCSASLLAKVAQMRPRDMSTMERVLGAKYAERFGAAFLGVLSEAS
jgi:ATP-dependent DNA helicase RecQ